MGNWQGESKVVKRGENAAGAHVRGYARSRQFRAVVFERGETCFKGGRGVQTVGGQRGEKSTDLEKKEGQQRDRGIKFRDSMTHIGRQVNHIFNLRGKKRKGTKRRHGWPQLRRSPHSKKAERADPCVDREESSKKCLWG